MDFITASLHILNILLAIGLLYVYGQNYVKIKSKYTAGLIVFVSLFLLQSFMGLYYDMSMVMYSSLQAETAAKLLEGLKLVSFAILLWVSWD
ncbi:MAG: hypothetical protein HY513_03070 [Candidatus Aenigmarchaeota archaeon]|nr:hypothetical protein [Candidatus Aenigmarchaeota archaeon]